MKLTKKKVEFLMSCHIYDKKFIIDGEIKELFDNGFIVLSLKGLSYLFMITEKGNALIKRILDAKLDEATRESAEEPEGLVQGPINIHLKYHKWWVKGKVGEGIYTNESHPLNFEEIGQLYKRAIIAKPFARSLCKEDRESDVTAAMNSAFHSIPAASFDGLAEIIAKAIKKGVEAL